MGLFVLSHRRQAYYYIDFQFTGVVSVGVIGKQEEF